MCLSVNASIPNVEVHSTRKWNRLVLSCRISNVEMLMPDVTWTGNFRQNWMQGWQYDKGLIYLKWCFLAGDSISLDIDSVGLKGGVTGWGRNYVHPSLSGPSATIIFPWQLPSGVIFPILCAPLKSPSNQVKLCRSLLTWRKNYTPWERSYYVFLYAMFLR